MVRTGVGPQMILGFSPLLLLKKVKSFAGQKNIKETQKRKKIATGHSTNI
jgi:hypothetical protein